MSTPISRGMVVTLQYEVRDAAGNPLEEEGATMSYLHGGFGGIFPKVEEALEGKNVGDEAALTLEPDDAFGEYDADLIRIEPRDRFPAEIEVGMQFEGVPDEQDQEAMIYRVTDVTSEKVVVDANHELAGERLWFSCSVRDVRQATDEELEHGHVHDESGLHTH
jgi:FKBP-type peptidyl-prolyl cis-trans isomerase SlyD